MFFINNKKNLQSGYSLVELLLAMGLFSVLVTTLFTGFMYTREGRPQQEQRFEATNLFQESIEALRVVREQGWDSVSTNGLYHPAETATTWSLVSGAEVINVSTGLTRAIEISDVYRDESGNIVSVGGTLDPSTKEAIITVSWDQPLISTRSTTIYLTRYLDNLAFIHTTDTDFSMSGSVANSVVYTTNADGEVVLDVGGPGRGNWCDPGGSAVSVLDLPRQGSARAVTAIQGKIFVGTGENASGVSLAYATVTNTVPPVTTLAGTFDGYKTNDVFGTSSYGFLATDTNDKEVVIVNLTDPMTEAGYYDIAGAADGDSIFVLGSVGYVTDGSTLYTFDVSSISGSSSQSTLGSISLAGDINSIYVVDGVAYVSINSTTNQLQIVDVSNSSSMSILGSLTLSGAEGVDVYISPDSTRAYVATKGDASKDEFFIVNIEDKSSPSYISSYDTNGMDPKAVDMVLSGNRAVIVGVGAEEYQVLTITPESNPIRCGGFNEDSGIYGISTVVESDDDAYGYITTGQSDSELKVIEGGPGGTFTSSGEYESAAFNTGAVTAFNRFTFTGTEPTNTTLRLQVAGAQAISGSCSGATYTFVGPDGTIDTYFTTAINAIPLDNSVGGYDNPAQCFKYKAYLDTTDILLSPVLEDVTVNYSP